MTPADDSLPVPAADADAERPLSVRALILQRTLSVHLQPIVALDGGAIHAHEALVRTPPGCAWSNPDALFAAARLQDASIELEIACVRIALETWAGHGAAGKLFINLSASALLAAVGERGLQQTLELIRALGVAPASIVIELTEHEHVRDVEMLKAAATLLRRYGIDVALDDFGDGRSSLRLWSELKPEIVKIDKYFTHELATTADKLQTWRALLQIAETFGSSLVAEGIETAEELRIVRDLGVRYAQGYYIGRPVAAPVAEPSAQAHAVLHASEIAVFPQRPRVGYAGVTAERLLIPAPALAADATHGQALQTFERHPELHALAIVDNGWPLALLHRQDFVLRYAKPYFRELYERRPALLHANASPLLLDVHTRVDDLTAVLTSSDQRYLAEGFILTEAGRYRGLGTGEHLVRAVTEGRIEAARHANSLTFLPGNIPTTVHIQRLLDNASPFFACYGDLNHFKPFNDQYGYWRGDEMILLAARVISSHCDPQRDFVGHVGGDDFIMLFQSEDWEPRCRRIVESFNRLARDLFDADALAAGGIHAEDRHGVMRFHPLTTLCIGAVLADAQRYARPEDVASAAAVAKRNAKLGNLPLVLLD
jgi:EAL domain-containing protein (putative c-di-GMP-specific phosphodiesterase class I)/GGDEF domain-containing protein